MPLTNGLVRCLSQPFWRYLETIFIPDLDGAYDVFDDDEEVEEEL